MIMENDYTQALDEARRMLDQAVQGGDPEIIHIQRLYLRNVGRRAAEQSGGKFGWCSHHDELHPVSWFTKDVKRKTGLCGYCRIGLAERKRLERKGAPKPTPKPTAPRAKADDVPRGRKCRRKHCDRRWTPAEGDTSRVCPPCRASDGRGNG